MIFRSIWAWQRGTIRRRVVFWAAAASLALLAVHAAAVVVLGWRVDRVVATLQSEWGKLDPARRAPPAVAKADNRARAIQAAMALLDDSAAQREVGWVAGFTDASEAELKTVSRSVAANHLALVLLDEARLRSGADWEIPYRMGIHADLPRLLDVIYLAKLNVAAGRLELRAGRLEGALLAVERGAALGASFEQESVLIMQNVHMAISEMNARLVRGIVAAGPLDTPSLVRLRAATVEQSGATLARQCLLGELYAGSQYWEEVRSGIPTGAPGSPPIGLQDRIGRAVLLPFLLDDMRYYLQHMDRLLRCVVQPRAERDAALCAEDQADTPSWRHALSGLMMAYPTALMHRADAHDARRALTETALALAAYKNARGSYPENLAELVPGFLSALPVDPFGGAAPNYERRGAGYALWSAGEGPHNPGNDDVLRWEIPS